MVQLFRAIFRLLLLELTLAVACGDSIEQDSETSPPAPSSSANDAASSAGALAASQRAGSGGVAGGSAANGGASAAGSGGAAAPTPRAGDGASGSGMTAGRPAREPSRGGAQAAAGHAASGSGGSGPSNPEEGPGRAGAAAPAPPTANIQLWLAGDSTVARGETPCPVGWGAEFQAHFSERAKVVNSAVGGRSVRTWLYNVGTTMDADGECTLARDASGTPTVQTRWQQMLDGMKSGDYLFIQFGINDSSPTCDRHVGLAAFKASYGMMAQAAKERGSQPIFVTPVSALACQGNTARGTRGEFVTATEEAGEEYGVPVIDLHARSVELYNALGLCPIAGGSDVSASTTGKAGDFFCEDHTHFERAGAQQIAELIVEALRDQSIHLAAYLK